MIIKVDKSDFESYLVDAANIKGDCSKVFFPENDDEVCSLLKESNISGQKITVSGGRTGLNGGCVPQNGILISLERLNKIISIDTEQKIATVQPGVILEELQTTVEKLYLFYPPDPTETNCTIGGTVANNASGARTFKYGPTRNYVQEISVILPTSEKINIVRGELFFNDLSVKININDNKKIKVNIPDYKMPEVKHSAGYFSKPNMDLIDLFIGSEGTLGIITEIKLKLIKLPENVLSMIVFFNDENDLFSFVNDLRGRSLSEKDLIDLREIEFFDKKTLNLLKNEFKNIPNNTEGAVWIEQEYTSNNEEELLSAIESLIIEHKGDAENIWFALNEKERNDLKTFRHKIPLKVNDIISGRGLVKIGTDTAVPHLSFILFYQFTVDILERNKLDYVVYGHIGNSHLHFNILPNNKAEMELGRKIYGEICKKSVELNGTISAEHGIGKLKTKYLLEMFGEENILKMARVKKTLDPNFILNIGNVFDYKYLLDV